MADPAYRFDDREIRWQKLGDFTGLLVVVFKVDEERNLADFIVKFEPNSVIFCHRHLALTNTLVIEGEHRIYETDGKALKEVRATGSYTSSPPGDAHREGGGADGCIVFYSIRGDDNRLFDVLDDDLNVAGCLLTQDFKAALEDQGQA